MLVPDKVIESLVSEEFPNFKYRENQKETIIKILSIIANTNKKFVILDAPTGCIHGDTKIRLMNGTTKNIKDLVGMSDFYVISSTKDGQIVPGKVNKVWKTKTTKDIVIVILADDTSVLCTPDHRFMNYDGTYTKAEDLVCNQSLMSMYIKQGCKVFPTRSNEESQFSENNTFLEKKNLKVKSVEKYVGESIDVYDMEVYDYHNFAIETSEDNSIIIHNSGKSHIANQVARVYNKVYKKDALIITKTISLQNQYLRDFPDIAKLMSASNYDCSVDYSIPIPPMMKHHNSCKYTKESGRCEYNEARNEFFKSKIKILNYAFFLYGINHYNTTGLLIADESHNLEESILDTFKTEINFDNLAKERMFSIELSDFLPNYNKIKIFDAPVLQSTIEYLQHIQYAVEENIIDIEELLAKELDSKNLIQLMESKLIPLESKLAKINKILISLFLLRQDDINKWDINYEEEENSFYLKPLFIPKILYRAVFEEPSKVLLMSATSKRTAQSLQLNLEDVEMIAMPYIFPLENRPFYCLTHLPNLNRNSFNAVFPDYVKTVDAIISQYSDTTNMIIHSVSYNNANLLKELSVYNKRIFIPTIEDIRHLTDFAGNGSIIVSPSISEGIDFGNGLATVQIFIKMPYPFLGDSWIMKKKDMDDGWYLYKTMLTIEQGSGRGVRSEADKSDIFMLDPTFKRTFLQVGELVAEWFLETIKYV